MDAKEMKRYLRNNPEKIVELLTFFGFHSFAIHENRVTAALPDGDNVNSVNIYTDSDFLNGIVWTRNSFKGDIYAIIEEFTEYNFKSIIINANIMFGFSQGGTVKRKTKKSDILNLIGYDKYRKYNQEKEIDFSVNMLYTKDILLGYAPYPHLELVNEGISPKVCREFGVHTDMIDERILFPHFDWIHHGKIVGVQARKIGLDNYTAKELGISKYTNYIKGYKKEVNLYGWAQNYKNIEEKKELIIFEGEKSVLKDATYKEGKGNAVALGHHSISKAQTRFITRNTSHDTEIIIAYDMDIFSSEAKTKKMLENLKELMMVRNVSFLYNKTFSPKILGEKDAPVDGGLIGYRVLHEHRTKGEKMIGKIKQKPAEQPEEKV